MIWSIYRSDTGVFTGQTFSGPRLMPGNIPEGCAAFAGEVDHRRKRLDRVSGELVDFSPPEEDTWIVESRMKAAAMAEIELLEKQQLRSAFELFDDPDSQVAREHFDRRKSRINELRQVITAPLSATKETP